MVTDNTNKTGLTETDVKTIAEMKGQIPEIEKILNNVGKILPIKVDMWYTGLSWMVKLDKKPVYLEIQYSDKRFEIRVIRLEPRKQITEYTFSDYNHKGWVFELCKFSDSINFERLEDKLVTFYNIL
jgi:hypothetical protein